MWEDLQRKDVGVTVGHLAERAVAQRLFGGGCVGPWGGDIIHDNQRREM